MVYPSLIQNSSPWPSDWGTPLRIGYAKGGCLYRQGESVSTVFIVLHGQVKLTCAEATGQDAIVGLGRCGSILGAESAVLGREHFTGAVALVESQVAAMSVDGFHKLRQQNLQFSQMVQERLADEMHRSVKMFRLVACYRPSARFDRLIRRLAGPDLVTLPPLRVYELAQMAGISREQASRYLARLIRDGQLRRRGGTLILASPDRRVKPRRMNGSAVVD